MPRTNGTDQPAPPSVTACCLRGKPSGRSAADGRPVEWGAESGMDSTRITRVKPPSATLRNGMTLEPSGNHEETPDEQRLERAKARFREEDDELNRVYKELKRSLPEDVFEELEANRRAWLKYRDYITHGADESESAEPGTVVHTWDDHLLGHVRGRQDPPPPKE